MGKARRVIDVDAPLLKAPKVRREDSSRSRRLLVDQAEHQSSAELYAAGGSVGCITAKPGSVAQPQTPDAAQVPAPPPDVVASSPVWEPLVRRSASVDPSTWRTKASYKPVVALPSWRATDEQMQERCGHRLGWTGLAMSSPAACTASWQWEHA